MQRLSIGWIGVQVVVKKDERCCLRGWWCCFVQRLSIGWIGVQVVVKKDERCCLGGCLGGWFLGGGSACGCFYGIMSWEASGVYGPSLHSKITVPLSRTSSECHCPAGMSRPYFFSAGERMNSDVI